MVVNRWQRRKTRRWSKWLINECQLYVRQNWIHVLGKWEDWWLKGRSGARGDKRYLSLLSPTPYPLDTQVLLGLDQGKKKRKGRNLLGPLYFWNLNIQTVKTCCLQRKHISWFPTFWFFAKEGSTDCNRSQIQDIFLGLRLHGLILVLIASCSILRFLYHLLSYLLLDN